MAWRSKVKTNVFLIPDGVLNRDVLIEVKKVKVSFNLVFLGLWLAEGNDQFWQEPALMMKELQRAKQNENNETPLIGLSFYGRIFIFNIFWSFWL